MKAVVLKELNKPEVGEFPNPIAKDNLKVVKMLAAGIGAADRTYATGFIPITLPKVIGMEGVGLVDGKRVYFDTVISPFGSLAEETLIDSATAIDVPDGVTDEQAITLGLSGSTAWIALSWRGKVQLGENVLVLGATGAVGKMAVQAAKLLGAGRVIAASRRGDGLEAIKGLGADATVVLEGDVGSMAAAIGKAALGKVDVILDLLWGPPAVAALLVASPNARLVAVGIEAGMEVSLSSAILMVPQASILGLSMNTVPRAVKREAYAVIAGHARNGAMKIPTETFSLADFQSAWKRMAQPPYVKVIIDLKGTKGVENV